MYKLALEKGRDSCPATGRANSNAAAAAATAADERAAGLVEADADAPSDEKEELEEAARGEMNEAEEEAEAEDEEEDEEEEETEKELSGTEEDREKEGSLAEPSLAAAAADHLYRISKPNARSLLDSESVQTLLLDNSKLLAAQRSLSKRDHDLASAMIASTAATLSLIHISEPTRPY